MMTRISVDPVWSVVPTPSRAGNLKVLSENWNTDTDTDTDTVCTLSSRYFLPVFRFSQFTGVFACQHLCLLSVEGSRLKYTTDGGN